MLEAKKTKKGAFRYDKNINVTYVNIDPETDPDHLCDIVDLPFNDQSRECVVMCEVFLDNPYDALNEVSRVLNSNGLLILSVPFLVGIHADPSDFIRYHHSS